MKNSIIFNIQFYHISQYFLKWEMYQTKVVEKLKTRVTFSNHFFRKSCRLLDNVEKYIWAGQATDGNMAHAYCMLYI